ncbi:MAG: hypothetical protein KIG45_02370, partial [Bacteroidales bacterium]|nr:hypothetical protein [Bacteroidales bacterium]
VGIIPVAIGKPPKTFTGFKNARKFKYYLCQFKIPRLIISYHNYLIHLPRRHNPARLSSIETPALHRETTFSSR